MELELKTSQKPSTWILLTPSTMEDATLLRDLKLRLKSLEELPKLTESQPTVEDAIETIWSAESGEDFTCADPVETENGVVKRMSTPSRMDTASNSTEPPSEMDKLMPPSLESLLLEVLSSKKVDAELPVSPTESGTDLLTVYPSLSGPTELEF